MILFLLKSSLVIAVLLLFYKGFLERESFFKVNRIYLIASLALAFTLPFVSLPELVDAQGFLFTKIEQVGRPNTADYQFETVVPDGNVGESSPKAGQNASLVDTLGRKMPARSLGSWLLIAYYFGAAIFGLRLLSQLVSVLWVVGKSKDKIKDEGYTIVNTSSVKDPCSFFNYIFIDPERFDLDTYEQIVAHEKIHAQERHTLDLLLAEFSTVILWFNPLVWLFRKEVEKNLEYQTDDLLVSKKSVERQTYQRNLLRIATFNRPLSITTNYNQSLLKQRIMKMNTKKSNPHSHWKYAFVVPVLFVTTLGMNEPSAAIGQVTKAAPALLAVIFNDEDCRDLLRAVKASNPRKVAELLKTTDPNCSYRADGEPRSPLVAAARNGDLAIGKLLLAAKADVEYRASGDESPLMAAAQYGQLDFVKYLVAEGAKINRKLTGDGTALLVAAKGGHVEVVKYLIAHNAEIDQEIPGDGTALICAVRNGHYSTAKLLLEYGADPYLEVRGDEYAMYHARRTKDKAMIALLQKYEK